MKGVVVDCLDKLVCKQFGQGKWREILAACGVAADRRFARGEDIEDAQAMKLFAKTCEITGLSFEEASEAYGRFWISHYIPVAYPEFLVGVSSAREMLLKLDEIHASVAARVENARPPRHSYEWRDSNTLLMSYDSERDLVELFIGAVKGVATHFGETIAVTQRDRRGVEIVFATSA